MNFQTKLQHSGMGGSCSLLHVMVLMVIACVSSGCTAAPKPAIGADIPWTTYEAEVMKTSGVVLGPKYDPFLVETESSNQRCVKLSAVGEFLEFTAVAKGNAMVIRYSLPDSDDGAGTRARLGVSINGKPAKTLEVDSHYAHLYGVYPFTNRPSDGRPRNFYDELRIKGVPIEKGDMVRVEFMAADTARSAPTAYQQASFCIVDLIDVEDVPAPVPAPADSLSVKDFGAMGDGIADDTAALRASIVAAQKDGKTVYVPPGDYKLTGDIVLTSYVTIQGAGMWHTAFVGDPELYHQADRRVRFKMTGGQIHLSDFAIIGKLNYRNDDEPNDGIIGAGCTDSSVSRIWVEHTKCGAWIYNGTNLRVEGCRFRNMLADGINLCVGTNNSVVENCTARGTGDDCFAIWPAAFDQGYVGQLPQPGNNTIRRCTGSLTFLANGVSVYGGANNRVEDCLFTDIATGCGVLISTTFPTADETRGIDNNFSGITTIRNIRLERCGGYDHGWAWRGSFQICVDRKSISGLRISQVEITDSVSDGLTIVAPGAARGQGILADAKFEDIKITNSGIGSPHGRDIWIRKDVEGSLTLVRAELSKLENDSPHFTIAKE